MIAGADSATESENCHPSALCRLHRHLPSPLVLHRRRPQPLVAPHPDPPATLSPAARSTVPTVTRPSLKITRHDDRDPPEGVSFEVWNPITARYEPMASLDDGLNRLTDLAERVRLMWVQHDPARTSLKDAPDPDEDDDGEWAELRV